VLPLSPLTPLIPEQDGYTGTRQTAPCALRDYGNTG
jgi:hypothetical protein